VREEIVARLRMRDPCVFVRGFNRPNIWMGVEHFRDEGSKREALVERVVTEPKPGIVYSATRRGAEDCAAELRAAGVGAMAYHGALPKRERANAQQRFMADEVEVIVATTAFGMGVDKPNVRFVFHLEVADSVDSHYQEIGRAGRDGEPARAVLFYRREDLGLRRFFAGSGQVDVDEIQRVADVVAGHRGPIAASELLDETDLSQSKLTTAVSRLEDAGAVEVEAGGAVAPIGAGPVNSGAVVERAAEVQDDREQFDRSRVEMVREYAELERGCRREFVLNYFGERFDAPCGRCDN
jgi:ATP-dependent DNA helicase RecQ